VDDTRGPTFNPNPVDKEIECGDAFEYDLNANDPSGVDHWSISMLCTGYFFFCIDTAGTIRNSTFTFTGTYELVIYVYDTIGNYRSRSFDVTVVDTTSPVWIQRPRDVTINYSIPFSQVFSVWDLTGISLATVDNPYFRIRSETLPGSFTILNTTTLQPSSYKLIITAYDGYSNSISREITVTVRLIPEITTTPPPIPGFPLAAIIFGVVVAVGPSIVYRRRKRL
jgi:hypothetical protein